MSQPLLATGRIVFLYTVQGIQHHSVAYIRGLAQVGSVWQHNSRALDANDQVWTDSVNGFFESMSYLYSSAWTAGAALLQQLSGTVWNPMDTASFTGTNHSASTGWASGLQSTLTLRDTAFKKMRMIAMEANYHGANKSTATNYFGDARDSFIKQWTASYTVTNAPYIWQVSRGNRYMATTPLISYVQAYNRKIRRARGIA